MEAPPGEKPVRAPAFILELEPMDPDPWLLIEHPPGEAALKTGVKDDLDGCMVLLEGVACEWRLPTELATVAGRLGVQEKDDVGGNNVMLEASCDNLGGVPWHATTERSLRFGDWRERH